MFIISQLWLTSHPRSTVDTGTPGSSREIYSEDADDGTRTHNPCLTQWLEHLIYNRGVASSSPIIGILFSLFADCLFLN